jgi:hypothetical protein
MKIKLTRISAANIVEDASEKYLKYWQTAWDKGKEYRKNLRLSYQDAADLFCVGPLLRQNRIEEARNLADGLDTAVREEISQQLHSGSNMEVVLCLQSLLQVILVLGEDKCFSPRVTDDKVSTQSPHHQP